MRNLLLLATVAFVGCAGVSGPAHPLVPAGEVPPGNYDVSALVALAPVKQGDGEVYAAVLYMLPSSAPLQIWEGTYPAGSRGSLVRSSLGKGEGKEHLRLGQSPAPYDVPTLASPARRTHAYSLSRTA